MGKTTNALESLLLKKIRQQDYIPGLEEIKRYHLEILDALFNEKETDIRNQIQKSFDLIEQELSIELSISTDELYDRIVSQGEIISSKITASFMESQGLHALWKDAR